jgi:hypothetical protein
MKFPAHNPIILTPIILLSACTTLWLDPIHQTGPDTYQITHNMGQFSPVKGVRQGTIDRATAKCANMGKSYNKVREDMGLAGSLSYNLTFQCK